MAGIDNAYIRSTFSAPKNFSPYIMFITNGADINIKTEIIDPKKI